MIVGCTLCPDQESRWEQDLPADRAQQALDAHQQRQHSDLVSKPELDPEPHVPVPVQQLANADWWTQAIDGIGKLAQESLRTGEPFTVYDIARHGIGEPANPRTDWGKLTRDAQHLRLIAHATDSEGRELTTRSHRPATKSSLVFQWVAGPAITGRPSASRSHSA